MVGDTRIELVTSSVSRKRSTSELTTRGNIAPTEGNYSSEVDFVNITDPYMRTCQTASRVGTCIIKGGI